MKKEGSKLVLVTAARELSPVTPAALYEVAAAKYVKIDVASFRDLVRRGAIAARSHPGRTRNIYLKEDLDAYLRALPRKRANGLMMADGESPSEPPAEVSIGR